MPLSEPRPHSLQISGSSGLGVMLGETLVLIDDNILTLPSRILRAVDRALPGGRSSHKDTKVLEPGRALQDPS